MPSKDRNNQFPVTKKWIYLNHCGVSPLPETARAAASDFLQDQSTDGIYLFQKHFDISNRFRAGFSRLLLTGAENLSFVKNTAEALGMIAGGYPFAPGDEIISYIHEYPSNHYPWKIQERRGAKLILLENNMEPVFLTSRSGAPLKELPFAWSMRDLEAKVTKRTKVIALSHVQFTSGFAADLEELGKFCRARNIDLVIDAAQSLGSLPLRPEEWGISAIAASGWKWMLGPMGTGFLYTAPEFREKLDWILGGAGLMKQGDDYLDHSWNPHTDGRAFEYPPLALMNAHIANLENYFTAISPEEIRKKIFSLQDIFLAHFKSRTCIPLLFTERYRSGILSFLTERDPTEIAKEAAESGLGISARGGYLRIAPHFYNTEEEMVRAAEIINRIQ